ncbi:HlyD family type I secretion periplasmic adaptor subunit [Janthinobacterium sp. 17J80-10]|uniref:HlyD family type I secretion periplasmic adaptor subunit n=1 Tax=Janthinobacterium sp. 17J80-10 TaxID=2497863 RepID=UPI001005526B|nr:HlyD family type I secretion periplasmic adaptor subunit [Janthinobacterium sp. 17J80-10]QAU35563.1 HlyD family type I secretion periplasmic adaptor subunit [Janthinobacterium sp. 17J80-10]
MFFRKPTDNSGPHDKLIQAFLPDARAIEHRPRPRWSQMTLYLLLLMMVVALLWATFSHVDRVVVARGKLVTPLPNIVVQPLEIGILKTIDVRLGQVVNKGQVLATLDPTFTGADASQLTVREKSLSAEVERLQIEMGNRTREAPGSLASQPTQNALLDERRANYESRLAQLNETVQRLEASLTTNRAQQSTLKDRLASLAELEKMRESLVEKQFGSKASMLEVRERRLEVEHDYKQSLNRENEIAREILASKAERDNFRRQWRQRALEDLTAAERQRSEVKEQLGKAQRRNELVQLVSPANAVVLEIGKKSVGSVIKDAEPLFVLVPLDAPLQAEVEVDSADVGDLRVGDTAKIKLDTYPFQKHGMLEGKLQTVSADAFARQANGQAAGAYYIGRIDIGSRKLDNMSGPAYLLPGMTVTSEMVVGKRSVISYFLYPVIRTLDEALRER